ncbi:MAG: response regulator transcription factor [Pseudomonadota bacterium]
MRPSAINVLLVEDDPDTAEFICRGLREVGDNCERVATAPEGLLHAASDRFHVIVFDRLLPGMDGRDAVRILREARVKTPILLLTAVSGIDDRVDGLNAGADDYMVKPFAFSELHARLRALSRRQPIVEPASELIVGDLHVDRVSQNVTRRGQTIALSPQEYRILVELMLNAEQVVTRTMLLERVWGYRFDPKTSLVQTHVSRLRAKVDRPFGCELIHTERGAGYMISARD